MHGADELSHLTAAHEPIALWSNARPLPIVLVSIYIRDPNLLTWVSVSPNLDSRCSGAWIHEKGRLHIRQPVSKNGAGRPPFIMCFSSVLCRSRWFTHSFFSLDAGPFKGNYIL